MSTSAARWEQWSYTAGWVFVALGVLGVAAWAYGEITSHRKRRRDIQASDRGPWAPTWGGPDWEAVDQVVRQRFAKRRTGDAELAGLRASWSLPVADSRYEVLAPERIQDEK